MFRTRRQLPDKSLDNPDDGQSTEADATVESIRSEHGGYCVAAVILNYNNARDTIDCVESLMLSKLNRQQIILLDNGSHKDELSRIETALKSHVELLRMRRNVGVASGWNIAIRHATKRLRPDFIFLLNNDTEIEQGVIDELVDFAAGKEDAGAVGPSIMKYDRRSETQYPRLRDVVQPVYDRKLSGCALLIRMEVFDEVGFFDEAYFAYAEEYDFLERMNQRGWRSYYVPTRAKVYHKGARTSSSISGFEAFHRTRNRLLFAGKNLKGVWLLANLISFFTKTLPLDIYGDLKSPERAMRLQNRARGFVEGIRLFAQYRFRP